MFQHPWFSTWYSLQQAHDRPGVFPRLWGAALIAFLLSLNLFSTQAKAEEEPPKTVAFLGMAAKGVSKDVASAVSDIVAAELGALPEYKLITADEINAMLGVERMKDSLGCSDSSCLAEIGGSLGADFVLSGSVGKLGDTFAVSLSLIDIAAAETKGRAQHQADSLNQLPEASRAVVAKLTGRQIPSGGGSARVMQGKGSVFVNTNPAGADIYIDGEKQETATPATIDDIQAGDHTLKVVMAEIIREVPIIVKPDQIAKYHLEMRVVRIKVNSVPFDAEVYFDGENRGTTPLLLPEVPAGKHEIVVKKLGYHDHAFNVLLDFEEYQRSGRATELSAELKLQPIPVQITSEPEGATVKVGGKVRGVTPLTLDDLLPGHHDAEVVLHGYRPEALTLHLHPGEGVNKNVALVQYRARADYLAATDTHRTLLVASGIAGGALAIGSAVMWVLASMANQDALKKQEAYLASSSPSEIATLREERKTAEDAFSLNSTLGFALGGAAIAALGAMTTMFFLYPDEPDYTTQTEVIGFKPIFNPGTGAVGFEAGISF